MIVSQLTVQPARIANRTHLSGWRRQHLFSRGSEASSPCAPHEHQPGTNPGHQRSFRYRPSEAPLPPAVAVRTVVVVVTVLAEGAEARGGGLLQCSQILQSSYTKNDGAMSSTEKRWRRVHPADANRSRRPFATRWCACAHEDGAVEGAVSSTGSTRNPETRQVNVSVAAASLEAAAAALERVLAGGNRWHGLVRLDASWLRAVRAGWPATLVDFARLFGSCAESETV